MSILVTFNGTQYTLPTTGETAWGTTVTNYLADVGTNAMTATSTANLLNKTLGLAAGTAAAPPLNFAADTDTGLYQPAVGQLALATNGVARLTIDGSGNITATGGLTAATLSGTLAAPTITTPAITGGTITNATLTNATLTGGSIANYLPLAGGTLTGLLTTPNLNITNLGGGAVLSVIKGAGNGGFTQYLTGGAAAANIRWTVGSSATPESGSNAGSDYSVYRYADNGAFLNTSMNISRKTGDAAFEAGLGAGANITAVGSVQGNGGVFVTPDHGFGLYVSGNYRILSYTPTWAWLWDGATGNHQWSTPNGATWNLRPSDNFAFNSIGTVGGNGAYLNISDASTKAEIVDSSHGLDAVLALTPRQFRRKSRSKLKLGELGDIEHGFVAQEVQKHLPHAVTCADFDGPDQPLLGMCIEPVVAALVNAVKELAARIAKLEAK